MSGQHVETHDPTHESSKGLAKPWVTLFNDTRNGFRNEMVKAPIANRAVRLSALGKMLEEAEASGNLVMASRQQLPHRGLLILISRAGKPDSKITRLRGSCAQS